ncbi:hypothetical protein DFH09DRAFT_1099879 [Mycena vulgaris]|nr:hypothetical protein DFH09DRAFT_1099879 [Mycena vulgaris]
MDDHRYQSQQPPPFAAPTLCCPTYFADTGNEDKSQHDTDPEKSYFAAVEDGVYMGVYSSLASLLKNNPNALYIKAATWAGILGLWAVNCMDYHHHEVPRMPPLVEPATLKYVRVAEELVRSIAESEAQVAPSRARIHTMIPEAITRPITLTPHTSDEELDEHLLPVVISDDEAYAPPVRDEKITPTCMVSVDGKIKRIVSVDGNVVFKRIAKPFPLMYGVSGHNHIFTDRARALEALEKCHGGELFFSDQEEEVIAFIEEEAGRMKSI